jgi:DNA-binding transcriptional regulator YiaG
MALIGWNVAAIRRAGQTGRQAVGLWRKVGLLGISLRTLHYWGQGIRKPSGAVRVQLQIAGIHPEIALESA